MGGSRARQRRSSPSRPRHSAAHRCSRSAARDSRQTRDRWFAWHRARGLRLHYAGRRPLQRSSARNDRRNQRSRVRWLPDDGSESHRLLGAEGAATARALRRSAHDASRVRAELLRRASSEFASSAPHPRPLPAATRGEGSGPPSHGCEPDVTGVHKNSSSHYPTFPMRRIVSSARCASSAQNFANSAAG